MLRKCTNEDELKSLYRKLAKHLHPDTGGDNELMKALQEAYEKQIGIINNEKESKSKKSYRKSSDISLSDEELINAILDYADKHPTFDDEFILSVRDSYAEYGSLTQPQRDALERVYKAFRMDKCHV